MICSDVKYFAYFSKKKLLVIIISWFVVVWNIFTISRKKFLSFITIFWFIVCEIFCLFYAKMNDLWLKYFDLFNMWNILIFLTRNYWFFFTISWFFSQYFPYFSQKTTELYLQYILICCDVKYFAFFSQKMTDIWLQYLIYCGVIYFALLCEIFWLFLAKTHWFFIGIFWFFSVWNILSIFRKKCLNYNCNILISSDVKFSQFLFLAKMTDLWLQYFNLLWYEIICLFLEKINYYN